MSSFVKASTYLYTVAERLYPSANPSLGRFRKRSIMLLAVDTVAVEEVGVSVTEVAAEDKEEEVDEVEEEMFEEVTWGAVAHMKT